MADFELEINLSGVERTRDRFGRFASGIAGVKRTILANVGEEVIHLIRDGFERESDPYGSKWAALKHRSGRILQDTGALRNSFHRKQLSSSQVTVGPAVPYARFHQSGTRYMPARKMVPDDGLPTSWSERINAVARRAMALALRE